MIYVYLFILGAVFGSFYTVIGMRRPLNQSIVRPASHCEYCQHKLKWYELIPIISFIIQKGKCRKCEEKLSLMYPLIETLSGILFALSFKIYGFSYNTLIMLCISSLLIIIFVSDFKYYIILDGPLVIFELLILIIKYLNGGLKEVLLGLGFGLLMMGVMILIKLFGDKVFKRESLGGGDIKLAMIMGTVLGFKLGLVALILSSFIALPYACYVLLKNKGDEMPLGPFLITALLIVFILTGPINHILEVFYL